MFRLVRFLQVLVVALICVSVQAIVGVMLGSIIRHDVLGGGGNGGLARIWEEGVPLAHLFVAAFFTIFSLPLLSISLLLLLGVLDFVSSKGKLLYIGAYAFVGLLGVVVIGSGLGPRPVVLAFAISYAVGGALAGFLHWYLVGRSAGSVHQIQGFFDGIRRRKASLCTYVLLAVMVFLVADFLYYRARLIWVSVVAEPDRGTPPYRSLRERDFTAAHKVALIRFPDASSCLVDSPKIERVGLKSLTRLDWTEIERDAEAEVCIFRLLASYPDISHATKWLEAQGFSVSETFSSAKPYVEPDGTLRVTGGWWIRSNGPKFPTHGMISRAFGSIPYGMSVDATWSSDGKRLLGVRISYSTL